MCWAVGFRPLLNQMNFLVTTVCRNGFYNGIMTYMFQIGEGAIHRIFVLWLIFMEVIF